MAEEIRYMSSAQSSIMTQLTIIIRFVEDSVLLQNTISAIIIPTANTAETVFRLIAFLLFSKEVPSTVPIVKNSDTPPIIDIRVLFSILFPQAYKP